MTLLFWLAFGFLAVQLVTLLSNLIFFPVLKTAKPKGRPSVDILIPVRNEADTLPKTLPRVLSQSYPVNVLVLNDQSTDESANVLRKLARERANIRVINGQPLPTGWSGKNWACHQLAERAEADILIFTDADVLWERDTLASLLTFRERTGADFVSVWPRQRTETFWERVTVPVTDLILLGSLPYLGVRYLPFGAFAAGNGQLMLWTAEAYQKVGGHAAVKREVLEDVRMGQRAKALGLCVALAVGGNLISTRMYTSKPEILAGFSKNILAAVSGSKAALISLCALNTLAHSLSWLFALFSPLWWLIVGMSLAQRALTCLKTRRHPVEALLQPLMAYPLLRIVVRALRQGDAYSWKGRRYEGAGR